MTRGQAGCGFIFWALVGFVFPLAWIVALLCFLAMFVAPVSYEVKP